jgi:hypothetical protein
VWRDEIVSFCPGIGKGRLYTADEIARLLERDALRAVAPPSRRRLDGDQ